MHGSTYRLAAVGLMSLSLAATTGPLAAVPAMATAATPSPNADAAPNVALFENVGIFDGKSSTLTPPSNVLVRGDKIERISTAPIPVDRRADTQPIDGGRTLTPGLSGMHWHTTQAVAPLSVLLADGEAEHTLMRGFTSHRDVGGPAFALKRAIDEGVVAGLPPGPQTLTHDWFGQGPAMRDVGVDLRLEWSQFYQGLTKGSGDTSWAYGGKLDAQARFDLSKFGLWNGLSATVQGNLNYGETVNGIAGSLLAVNTALFLPGIEGADASDIMALYVQQNFGDRASVLVGKLNLVEFARGTPLRGGGGVDTFWNVNLATPITGDTPPTIVGAQLRINTQPVSYSLTVFDAQDATNKPLFSNLLEEGVNVMGTATLKTAVAGRPGYYGIKGIYSTREGADLSQIIPPPGISGVFTKQGSWYVGLSMQQYLVQDPSNPARGCGRVC